MQLSELEFKLSKLLHKIEEETELFKQNKRKQPLISVVKTNLVLYQLAIYEFCSFLTNTNQDSISLFLKRINNGYQIQLQSLLKYFQDFLQNKNPACDQQRNAKISKNLEEPVENNERYVQEIKRLNDEIKELAIKMKLKDKLLKDQHQALEEIRLIEKTLQDFFVEHLKENLRQKAQDLHISFTSQSLNKQKRTTLKKEKGYFSDEETANPHSSSFPKLDDFFPELEKVITNEILNFKKTIREYRTYTTTIQKKLKTSQQNNVTAILPESDENLQDQIQDILSGKEKALDLKKAEVEKELKKMLLGISTQREDLILAQKEILNTKWMNLCNYGSKHDISLRESLHRALTITDKDNLFSELQTIITKPKRKIKMFTDKIDIGTEPDPKIFDIDIVKIQTKRIERLEFEVNAGFQDKKTLMGQIELKNKQIIECKGICEEIKKKLKIEQISHAEIQIRIKEFIDEAEQQQRIINELEEKVEKKKVKIQTIKAAVLSNNQGALELIRKKTVLVKEKWKNENKDFNDFEQQLKNKINDYKMLHKRGILEMEKLMVEFEEVNIENRKLKYEIARLKEDKNGFKKQIQDSKFQATEKEKEVWRLMQENDSCNNVIEKLLQKNNDLFFDLQKNSNKSEVLKEKPEKIEKSEKLERIEKVERLEKFAKHEKFDKTERPEKREKYYSKQTKTNKNNVSSNDLNSTRSLKKFVSQSNEVPIKQKSGSTLSVDKEMNINEVYLNVSNENRKNNNISAANEKKEAKEKMIKSKNKKENEIEAEEKNILSINREKIDSGIENNIEASNLKYSINIVETTSKRAISENSYHENEKTKREAIEEMNKKKVKKSVVPVFRNRKSKAISFYEPKLGVKPKKEEVKELDTYPKDYMKTIEAKLQSQSFALEILKKSDELSSASFEFLEKEKQRTNSQVSKNEPRKTKTIISPNVEKINETNAYSNKKEEYRLLIKNDLNSSSNRNQRCKEQSENKNENTNIQMNDALKNDDNILTSSKMEKKRKNSYNYLNEQIINERKNLNAFYKNNEIKSMEKVEIPKEMKTNLDYKIENMDKFFPSYKSKKNSDSPYLDSGIRKENNSINKTQDIASFNKKSFIAEQETFENLQEKIKNLKNLTKSHNPNNDTFSPINPSYYDDLNSGFIKNQFTNENDINDNENTKNDSSMDRNKYLLKFDENRKNDKKSILHNENDRKDEISENSNNYNENELNFVMANSENQRKNNTINRSNHQIPYNESNRKLDPNMIFNKKHNKNLLKNDSNKIDSYNRGNYNFDQESNNEMPLNYYLHCKTLRFVRKAASLSPPHIRNLNDLQSENKEHLNEKIKFGNQMSYTNAHALNEKIHKIKSISDKERVTKDIVQMPSEIPKNINVLLKEEKINKKYHISRSTQTDSNPSTKSTQTDWIKNRSISQKSKSFHSNSTITRIPEEEERRDEGKGFWINKGRKEEQGGGSSKEVNGKKENVEGSLTLDGFNKKSHLKPNDWKIDYEKAYLKKKSQNASKDSSIYSKLLFLSTVPILPSSLPHPNSFSCLPPSSNPPSSSFNLPPTSFLPDPSSITFSSLPQSSFPPSSFQPLPISSNSPPLSSFIPHPSSSLPPPTIFKEIRKLFYEIIGEEAPPLDSSDFVEIKRIELPERKDFEEFCRIIREEHPRCGVNCEHLKRFYERLGAKKGGREVMVLHKRDIDRLPKIKKVVVV